MYQTLEDCAKALDELEGKFEGIADLATSLRKEEVPILLIGHLDRRARDLVRITDRIREIITEEQRKVLEDHGHK